MVRRTISRHNRPLVPNGRYKVSATLAPSLKYGIGTQRSSAIAAIRVCKPLYSLAVIENLTSPQQPGVADRVRVVEGHRVAVKTVRCWHQESALRLEDMAGVVTAILPGQGALLRDSEPSDSDIRWWIRVKLHLRAVASTTGAASDGNVSRKRSSDQRPIGGTWPVRHERQEFPPSMLSAGLCSNLGTSLVDPSIVLPLNLYGVGRSDSELANERQGDLPNIKRTCLAPKSGRIGPGFRGLACR